VHSMLLITLGLLIWIAVHLFPSLAPNHRKILIARIGEIPYQGMFAVLILIGLGLIIYGWRHSLQSHLYYPIYALRHPAMLLVALGFVLMTAANFPDTRVKQFIRHPQLSGVLLWAVAHLFMNGDSRSVLVFTAMLIWSVLAILLISRRDGKWIKPAKPSGWNQDILIIIFGLGSSVVAVYFHEYLSGIKLLY